MIQENPQIMGLGRLTFKTKFILGSVFILILVFVLMSGYFVYALSPVSSASDVKGINVGQGESFGQIAKNLENIGLVRSNTAFDFFALISGNAHKLKPGQYFLDASWSSFDILKALVAGPELERAVVIPEGFTLLDIDKKLSDLGIIEPKSLANFNFNSIKDNYEFLKELKSPIKTIEGYLFPDTYNFFINSAPEEVARKFLDNFNAKAWPFLKGQSMAVGKMNLNSYQILIVSSLIEKEVYFEDDGPMVAGIIYKRLKIGMAIQIDASIVYAKCGGYIFYCDSPALARSELSFVSPYNTYLHKDLPPAPISNPGLASINAALHPKNSDYLYYLSDLATHKIIYSKTLEEHNANKVKYLN